MADAVKYKETIKQQFVDYRSKFRQVMNEVRSDHYDSFAQLGAGKESSRVAASGEAKSGKNVYKQISEEVKQMKERLKAAGVNRIIAGINDQEREDEEYYDEEEEEEAAAKETEEQSKPSEEP